MHNDQAVLDVLDAVAKRRNERRSFLQYAGAATVAAGGLSLLAACGDDNNSVTVTPTPTPSTAIGDGDILNFALNLEYLEAQFYSYAVFGVGLNASLLAGVGTQGTVADAGTATGPRQVNFAGETLIGQYAREIAADEINHVAFLRAQLSNAAVAQPAINISGNASGAFTAVARAAGIVGPNANFDPYSSPDFFLLGAFIFEDVGVTAYKGAAPLLSNKVYLEAAAGILAAEAYHAGLVRTILYARGQSNASLITIAGQISDVRDGVDGAPADNTTVGIGADDDQGIVTATPATAATANLVPTNANGLAYSRSTGQVLNVVYGNATAASVSSGAFFPAGVNGAIRASATK